MKRKPSKVSIALAYLKAHPEASRYQAALHAGMTPTSLYKRLKADKAKSDGICPTCHQKIAKAMP